jgi:hypothetical protein
MIHRSGKSNGSVRMQQERKRKNKKYLTCFLPMVILIILRRGWFWAWCAYGRGEECVPVCTAAVGLQVNQNWLYWCCAGFRPHVAHGRSPAAWKVLTAAKFVKKMCKSCNLFWFCCSSILFPDCLLPMPGLSYLYVCWNGARDWRTCVRPARSEKAVWILLVWAFVTFLMLVFVLLIFEWGRGFLRFWPSCLP